MRGTSTTVWRRINSGGTPPHLLETASSVPVVYCLRLKSPRCNKCSRLQARMMVQNSSSSTKFYSIHVRVRTLRVYLYTRVSTCIYIPNAVLQRIGSADFTIILEGLQHPQNVAICFSFPVGSHANFPACITKKICNFFIACCTCTFFNVLFDPMYLKGGQNRVFFCLKYEK